jgi:hypothetical protein
VFLKRTRRPDRPLVGANYSPSYRAMAKVIDRIRKILSEPRPLPEK